MTRQALDDGGWFDLDRAEKYSEETRWNGHNHISLATGSQWDHEDLYRTAQGSWVLHHWSQYQGSTPSWQKISPEDAVAWLILNKHKIPANLAEVAGEMEV